MPRFRQITEMLKLMDKKEHIRNIGVVAHIDHGKTTMTDWLLAKAGMLPSQVAGTARALDYLEEEQKRGITMKTANVSMLHEVDGKSYVINLIDTPGHIDFTGKVTRALLATDGVVVVVDAVEELMAQTRTVVRQALEVRVKPVLFINKVDRLIGELKLGADEIQARFTRIINEFNDLVEIHGEPKFKAKWKVDPFKNTVAFGSALHGWGFTLGMVEQKAVKFKDIIDANAKDSYRALAKLLPLHDAILDMIVRSSPSPIEAQKYRVPMIWKGKIDSEICQGMLNCDDNGPTAMCITRVQVDPKTGLVASGRLFSGSVEEGDRIYLVGAKEECTVRQVSIYMSAFREAVKRISAGNIAALTGLDIAKTGEMLVDIAHKNTAPFEQMKYISEPVVTVAVEPRNPRDLPRLRESLDWLSMEDPNLVVNLNENTGEYLLSGIGELHLETAVELLSEYDGGIGVTTSEPAADYRESITEKGLVVMAKSPNKLNKFWVQVEPLQGEISKLTTRRILATDKNENILMDSTKNHQDLDETKESVVAGFRWACKTGPLCERPLRNVKVKLLDAQIEEDPAQRGPTQIMRAMSRAIFGSFLTAHPILLEPIYKIEITTPTTWFGTCSGILASRGGRIKAAESKGSLTIITAYMPVAEALGMSAEMRSTTSGHAFWQNTFAYWEKVSENKVSEIIRRTRIRRGLQPEVPEPSKFVDEV